jgi:predicted phage gp36 major capsid-like protein
LLFGEAKRTAEQNCQALDDKLEAMRADFLARFSALESRLVDLARDTEQNQAASVNAIGSAITQLGATVQNLSVRRKGG